ncbi:transcriptional regulator [Klebsiella sp. PL-2018]|uniref:transcriptional regulator n=1 Tax=Klebsiella sp. PL-2018 TaxID=2851540 RepID=UPI001C23F3BE|nr:YdaS family helix-turn-helix protein [Klebsiella sp. PL-2018]
MKKYWDALSKQEQQALASCVGTTPGYLRLVFNGYKKAGFGLAKKIESATGGVITKSVMRPDIY